ncbi:hypothetical protein SAMN05660464_1832 [Geodermatophilus dictyosporus]|uniref:Uncharacterized protein n=1 Tax=Geodermatophilus dictyosporus TaxID=1523247 RepID=A0A1I5LNN9_9ACTN|nr:hypothetical protein [Geodermatophilus dictyosporus]SFO98928.1 hypothetical protein SAMN05660464_1832 [Geodermatophilus dictyosporus]
MPKKTRQSSPTVREEPSLPAPSSAPPSGGDLVAIVAILASLMAVTLVITRDVDQAMQVVAAMAAVLVLLGLGRSARH